MAGVCRQLPNILITGTPGTGKTTTASELAAQTGLRCMNIGEIAKENDFYEGWDEELECHVLDEDKVLDELEDIMCDGGNIVDYHSCDFFPERWFDIVFVLRTNNTCLFDRLKQRGYSDHKVTKNVECEIFQTILEEAKESYRQEIVHELQSNTPEELEKNVEEIKQWCEYWKRTR